MFPNLGWAQETCQTGPSWLVEDAWVSAGEAQGDGGDIPTEGLEETVIVAVDFEDLDGLVGGAGLQAVCVLAGPRGKGTVVVVAVKTYGEAFAVVVQSAVMLEESQYRRRRRRRRVGGGGGREGVCLHSRNRRAGELTIMSSWRFDSCVYGGHPRQRSRANTPRRTDLGAAGPGDVPFQRRGVFFDGREGDWRGSAVSMGGLAWVVCWP